VTVLPKEAEARRGYELLRRDFPAQAANRIVAIVQFPSGSAFTPERMGALYDASRAAASLPGVVGVESLARLDPRLDRDAYVQLARMPAAMRPPELQWALDAFVAGPVTAIDVLTEGPPSSPAAQEVVRKLRENRSIGDGLVLVGGPTAHDLDASAYVRAHTPAAIAFVMTMTFLVLFALLGSVVLPLKAVLMNLLSITGSFGAMVWIFQEGHLRNFLDFEPRPLEPALPVLLFCLVFGLSMDYEVLLLSRMQEEYRRTGDNTQAVAHGLEKSAGLITSAAAIMVAVFAAFALAHVVVVKAMGVGLAIAVTLDATLVRVLIVPATMRLFGDLNWWAPAPIARMHAAWRAKHGAVPHQP
jgi:RND superfamily putative drug exporter